MSNTKRCAVCGQEKTLDQFRPEKRNKDGLAGKCKDCARAHSADYYQKNRGKVLDAVKQRYQEKSDEIKQYKKDWSAKSADRLKAKRKEYYQQKKDEIRERSASWYRLNRERAAKQKQVYRASNREKFAMYHARRRSANKNSAGSFTKEDVQRLLKLQRWTCIGCRASLKKGFHIDHVFPVSKGGSSDPSNIQLLCPHCNRSKSAMHPADFMAKKGFLL